LGQSDVLTGGQFFAALRLVIHAELGDGVDRGLAFVQGALSFRFVSFRLFVVGCGYRRLSGYLSLQEECLVMVGKRYKYIRAQTILNGGIGFRFGKGSAFSQFGLRYFTCDSTAHGLEFLYRISRRNFCGETQKLERIFVFSLLGCCGHSSGSHLIPSDI
jgi:hypothetical protein